MELCDFDESKILEKLHEQIKFEELIFHLTKDSFPEVKQILSQFNTRYVQSLLFNAADLFQLKAFADVFSLTGKSQIDSVETDSFSDYLFIRGLTTKENYVQCNCPVKEKLHQIDVYENPAKENSLLWYIKTDDVTNFVKTITLKNINPNTETIMVVNLPFLIIDITCYVGAINFLKYLLLNNVEITENTISSAVLGGHENIVEFLHEHGASFAYSSSYAIWRHHNSLAKWLIDCFKCTDITPAECVFGFNTEMLLYFIEDCNIDINLIDEYKKTALHWAVEHNDVNVVKYLLLKGIDQSIVDIDNKLAIDYAATKEMKEIIDFYNKNSSK